MSRYREAARGPGDRARLMRFRPRVDVMERRLLLTNYVVTSTSDPHRSRRPRMSRTH